VGKGSAPRPIPNPEKFSDNWDRIFGRKDGKNKSDTAQPKKTEK
jgi:hypothetical protein